MRRPFALIVPALTIVLLTSCNTRRPDRFLIPDGYKGWVKVKFQVANAPALPVEDKHWLLRVDGAGHLETSTILAGGIANDEYYYVSGNRRIALRKTESCGGGSIWGVHTGSELISDRPDTEWFFVGSQAEYRQQVDPGERIYVPCLDSGNASAQ